MQTVEDILRHHNDGLTIVESAAATGNSTGTGSCPLDRDRAAGIG